MNSDAIGEYYCLCELLFAKKEAYLANGMTQKGWDIAVLENHRTIRVQVKCISWNPKKQAAVKGTFIRKEFDYLVIVLLNFKDSKFTPFVIPYEKLKEKTINERNLLIDDEHNVYFSARKLKDSGNDYKKQTIAISTLQHDNIYEKFKIYESNFSSITSLK